ncbi:MAG TPA: imidazole glycerol phosphate synthase subunit HisH [Caulobacteraceae bacterium]|nr:imidazole glycerol phosphate synthase subunit HisH [Caulobacteraceae bacterium]
MQSIVLIDYGSGNLRSAEKALQRAARELGGARQVATTSDPDQIAQADAVVLPGVGAFAACMRALNARPGVAEAMTEAVKRRGVPFLGVCVGMQLMADRGLEFGETPGLGWISGDVKRIAPTGAAFKVPHMGWNDLVRRPHPIFTGLSEPATMYFTHSFAFHPTEDADVLAETNHGGRFPAAVARGNMAGVQFHPEKSQGAGLALLANFLEWRP